MEFKVGQDIVYPKYGVGKILEIKAESLPEGRTKGVLIRFPPGTWKSGYPRNGSRTRR